MTSHYRHRRTSTAATPFPTPVEPGEIVVNTANRQLVVGDAASATLGQPVALLAVRLFDARAQYASGDFVVQGGKLYCAKAAIVPGAFNATQWDAFNPSDVNKAYVDAGDAAVTTAFQSADTTLQTNINAKADKTYVDAADTLKADKTYVDAADALKADKTYVDSQNTAQDTAISGKVAKAGDTMTGQLNVKPATGGGFIGIDNTVAAQMAAIILSQGGTQKWQIGKLADDSFIIYDAVSGTTIIQAPSNGAAITFNRPIVGAGAVASAAEYIANSAPGKMLTPGAAWGAAAAIASWADGATVTFDFGAAIDFVWAIGAAGRTLANPDNQKVGQKGLIILQQGVANATVTTWGNAWKFPGGIKPTLSTTAGAQDVISYWVVGANYIFCTFQQGFA